MEISNITPFIRKYLLPLSLGFFGLILSGYGMFASFSSPKKDDIKFIPAKESGTDVKSVTVGREITVDVSGAVMEPGVYQLPVGSRLEDALIKAGGLSQDADREVVARYFNLAAKLMDGSKVYIPKVGESIGSTAQGVAGAPDSGLTKSGLININTASEVELDTLSGVGPVTAGKIIDSRPYSSTDELIEKKIVNRSVFEKIKEKITVY